MLADVPSSDVAIAGETVVDAPVTNAKWKPLRWPPLGVWQRSMLGPNGAVTEWIGLSGSDLLAYAQVPNGDAGKGPGLLGTGTWSAQGEMQLWSLKLDIPGILYRDKSSGVVRLPADWLPEDQKFSRLQLAIGAWVLAEGTASSAESFRKQVWHTKVGQYFCAYGDFSVSIDPPLLIREPGKSAGGACTMRLSGVVDLVPQATQFHGLQRKLPCTIRVDRSSGWIRIAPEEFNDHADELLAALEDESDWQALSPGEQFIVLQELNPVLWLPPSDAHVAVNRFSDFYYATTLPMPKP